MGPWSMGSVVGLMLSKGQAAESHRLQPYPVPPIRGLGSVANGIEAESAAPVFGSQVFACFLDPLQEWPWDDGV